jgi:hypothetical protein
MPRGEFAITLRVLMLLQGKVFHENFDVFLGDGIFNVDGEIWKKQRKTASFEFASRKLRDYSTVVFRDYSVKLASILTNASMKQQAMDMQVSSSSLHEYARL